MHSKRHNQNWEVLAITRSVAEVGVAEDFIWQTNFHICNYVIANMEEEDLKETLVHGGLCVFTYYHFDLFWKSV